MFSTLVRTTFLVLIAVSFAAENAFAQKRNITEKDLFDFVWIGDPQVSPDGNRVAFVRMTVNEKKDGYDTSIWMVATAGDDQPHQLTNGKHDSSPRWSPDGKYLCFVRAVEKDGKPEPPQLCMLANGRRRFVCLHRIAERRERREMVARRQNDRLHQLDQRGRPGEAGKEKTKGRRTKEERGSRRRRHRHRTKGKNRKRSRRRRLTSRKPMTNTRATSTSSRARFIVPMTRVSRSETPGTSLDRAGAAQRRRKSAAETNDFRPVQRRQSVLVERRRPNLFHVAARGRALLRSAEDGTLFDSGKRRRSHQASQPLTWMWARFRSVRMANRSRSSHRRRSRSTPTRNPICGLCDLARDAKPRNLTETFDYDFGSGVFGDNAPPRAGGGTFRSGRPDGKSLIDVYGKEGRTILARFDATTGAATDLTNGNQAVVRFRRVTRRRENCLYTLSTATRHQRLVRRSNNAGVNCNSLRTSTTNFSRSST